jgi:hypothetical protein
MNKIITQNNVHVPEDRKRLKLSSEIISDIFGHTDKSSKIQILIGNEVLYAYFSNETFSVSAKRNEVLETEIIDKLESEFSKKYPGMCNEFTSRLLDK